jgi:(+)-trans-carveol dehydrogenase
MMADSPADLAASVPTSEVEMAGRVEGKVAKPVDISNAVLFLASEEARYITGLTLTVDAGSMLK